MGVLRSDVSGIYDPKKDHGNKTVGNFADTINGIYNAAVAGKKKLNGRKKYGPYSSKGAQATPESRRLTRRISSEND